MESNNLSENEQKILDLLLKKQNGTPNASENPPTPNPNPPNQPNPNRYNHGRQKNNGVIIRYVSGFEVSTGSQKVPYAIAQVELYTPSKFHANRSTCLGGDSLLHIK